MDTSYSQGAKIRVVGVGGGGGNAINSMINRGLTGVDFVAANTDAQALDNNLAPVKIQVGSESTRGLGAGADPSVGGLAVEESMAEIREALTGSDMVFLTAGMGGGTGTGGAPVVAKAAQELGALTVAIVTKPFLWEGGKRAGVAEAGIAELRKHVDALIVIPNQKLMSIIDKHTSFVDAFQKVDNVLHDATRGIADIISGHGYINVDFADVRTIMRGTGDALMGTGTAGGENRAVDAAQNAISSPLLEGVSIKGAQGVLVNITGGMNMTMFEIGEAISVIESAAGADVNLIHGIVFDEKLEDQLMVTVVATGFRRESAQSKPYAAAATKVQDIHPDMKRSQRVEADEEQKMDEEPQRQTYRVSRPMPNESPSGVQELQKYDEPAYQRRSGGGTIRLNTLNSVSRDMDFANDEHDSQEDQQQQSDFGPARQAAASREKPAFLRKIMD